MFSHDVMAAILVSQNNETETMLVSQTNPMRFHSVSNKFTFDNCPSFHNCDKFSLNIRQRRKKTLFTSDPASRLHITANLLVFDCFRPFSTNRKNKESINNITFIVPTKSLLLLNTTRHRLNLNRMRRLL